jgi:hypothetical protein
MKITKYLQILITDLTAYLQCTFIHELLNFCVFMTEEQTSCFSLVMRLHVKWRVPSRSHKADFPVAYIFNPKIHYYYYYYYYYHHHRRRRRRVNSNCVFSFASVKSPTMLRFTLDLSICLCCVEFGRIYCCQYLSVWKRAEEFLVVLSSSCCQSRTGFKVCASYSYIKMGHRDVLFFTSI